MSQEATSDSETSLNLEEVSTKSTNVVESQETVSTSSCDSGLDSLQSGVNLRPRKRTKSSEDGDGPKKSKKVANGRKKGVGLKNLGKCSWWNSRNKNKIDLLLLRQYLFYEQCASIPSQYSSVHLLLQQPSEDRTAKATSVLFAQHERELG